MNWGFAETMAYASLLEEGYGVRLSGQDCGRGTFAHRHAVLHDINTGKAFIPLNNIKPKAKRSERERFSLLILFFQKKRYWLLNTDMLLQNQNRLFYGKLNLVILPMVHKWLLINSSVLVSKNGDVYAVS